MTLDDIYGDEGCGSCPCVKYYVELSVEPDCSIRVGNAKDCNANPDILQMGNTVFSASVGFNQTSFSRITVNNGCGEYDAAVCECFWAGREARLYVGLDDWSCGDYQSAFCGFISSNPSGTLDSIEVQINGFPKGLDSRVLGDLNGLGEVIPRIIGGTTADFINPAIGVTVKPVLIDFANLVYQVSNGNITSIISVYDNGVELTPAGTTASIPTTTVAAGSYVYDPATGEIELGAIPAGDITVEVVNNLGFTNTNNGVTTAQVIQTLLSELGLDAQINAASLEDFNRCFPYPIGLAVTDETTTYLDLLNSLMQGAYGWWGVNRSCEFEFGCYRTGELISINSDPGSAAGSTTEVASCSYELGSCDIQNISRSENEPAFTTINIVTRDWVNGGNLTSSSRTNSDAQNSFEENTLDIPTYLLSKIDMSTFSFILANTFSGRRECFDISLMCGALRYERGKYICIDHDRYGLNKQLFYIESVTENVATMQATLRVCRTLALRAPDITCGGPFSFTQGPSFRFNPASNTGGQSFSWSITPSLPAFLTLNSATGAIDAQIFTGASLPLTEYTITASNALGSSSCSFTIEVA